MLYLDIIDVSEGIDVNKASASSAIFVTIGISQIRVLSFN